MPSEYTNAPLGSLILIDSNSVSSGFDDGVQTFSGIEIADAEAIFRHIRRGQLLFADGFEATNLKGISAGTGSGAQTTAAGQVFHGSGALLLTTGATSGNSETYDMYLSLPPLKRLIVGGMLAPSVTSADWKASIQAIYTIGALDYYAGLQIDATGPNVNYLNSSDAWAYIGNNFVVKHAYQYFPFFIEIDTINKIYQRAYFPFYCMNLSAYSLYNVTNNASQQGSLDVTITVTTATSAARSLAVDDLVVAGILNLT